MTIASLMPEETAESLTREIEELEAHMQPDFIREFISQLPEKALNFGLRVLGAVVFFLIGAKLIKIIRKIIKNLCSAPTRSWA